MPTEMEAQKVEIITNMLQHIGMEKEDIETDFLKYLCHTLGRSISSDDYYLFKALSFTTRDRLMSRWKKTWETYNANHHKKAYYLSMEFLIGRSLTNNLLNLGIENETDQAMYDLGLKLE
jgi:starch phosphorylase